MIRIDCQVRRGGFTLALSNQLGSRATGIFGPSGSGKSSLLLALTGLIPVEQLRLELDGEVLVDTSTGLIPPAHRRQLGMVFQDHRLFPHLSMRANLSYAKPSAQAPAMAEVVELLDIGDLLDHMPAQCSGGQRQRVALGRALLSAPRLLLLDEPLASLDRGLKRQILPYLRRIRNTWNLPMLMVSHDLGELLALTDSLLLLHQGRIAGQGDLATLAADPTTLELLHDCGLVLALPGTLNRRDEDGLAWIRLDGPGAAELACGDCPAAVGDRVDALLRPEDLVLARAPLVDALSLTNRLPGRIVQLTRSRNRCIVTVDCGASVPLLAEVAERAMRSLGLTVGDQILVLCKAQAVQMRSLRLQIS